MPRQLRSILLSSAKHRAQRDGLPFNLTLDDVVIPDRCPALGIPLKRGQGKCTPNSPTLDRIVNEWGYVRGNVVVVSFKANTTKSNLTLGQLEQMVKFYKGLVKSLSPGSATKPRRKP